MIFFFFPLRLHEVRVEIKKEARKIQAFYIIKKLIDYAIAFVAGFGAGALAATAVADFATGAFCFA